MTDLVLVNPNDSLPTQMSAVEPPFWCMMLSSYIKSKGYQVKIIDAEAEELTPEVTAKKIRDIHPRLVAIVVQGRNPSASSTPKMVATHKLLECLNYYPSILIGIHPSALPSQTFMEEKATYICQGEGFITLQGLLEKQPSALIEGLWPNQPAPLLQDLPTPDWDGIDIKLYKAHNWHCFGGRERSPYGVLYTSLGCPYKCFYCNIKTLYNGKPGIRYRKLEDVYQELDFFASHGIKNIKIMDELFTLRGDRVADICDYIIKKGYDFNIWAYARVDTVNKQMLKRMQQAGINWLCYGFESASEMIREGSKKHYEQEIMEYAVRITQYEGINILANFIFGLPDDTIETMQETLDISLKYQFEFINYYVAMAYPGSDLYSLSGLGNSKTWGEYAQYSSQTVPMGTKYLSPQEVLDFRDKAFKKYVTNPEYLAKMERKFGIETVNELKGMAIWNPRGIRNDKST